eukprot:NODE_118_length_18285_cov_1.016606.p15 type:complete len:100 gc:universal NODE_118_length_18285_cov_1.016606:15767-15468(-)
MQAIGDKMCRPNFKCPFSRLMLYVGSFLVGFPSIRGFRTFFWYKSLSLSLIFDIHLVLQDFILPTTHSSNDNFVIGGFESIILFLHALIHFLHHLVRFR